MPTSSSRHALHPRHSFLPRALAVCALVCALASVPALADPAVSTIFAFRGSVGNGGIVQGPDGALYGTTSTGSPVTGGLVYSSALNGVPVTTIHQFTGTEGSQPSAGLLQGSDGYLYGVTRLGEASKSNEPGTVFRLAYDGSGFEILHYFALWTSTNVKSSPINTDGAYPSGALIEGSDGYLYGVTLAGGSNGTGVIFRMSRDGSDFQAIFEFSAVTSSSSDSLTINETGSAPKGALLQAPDGYLYGATSVGGSAGRGTIFRVHMDGSGFEVVHDFTDLSSDSPYTNVDGAYPPFGLTDGQDGLLYGVANSGGSDGAGTVFSVDPNSLTFTVLHDFDTTGGSVPSGPLLLASDSLLYGVTAAGGTNSNGDSTNYGTLYSIARDGTGFQTLYSFDATQGSAPSGPLLELDPNTFIGVTTATGQCGQGTLFQLSLTGDVVAGNTTCGLKKQNKGGGGLEPEFLLLLVAAGLLRRRRRA
jgi:uncharacterized repeat protein (TIGR03803 family)